MKNTPILILAMAASLSALAAYPDAAAARKAAAEFNAKKQYAEAVAAYDEAIALAQDENSRKDAVWARADDG